MSSRTPIPERAPLGDSLRGFALHTARGDVLSLEPQPGAEVIAAGTLVVRYGLRYLGKSFLSIVPGLVALEYGEILTGEDAWTFLLKQSNLHPRAEIFGYRNDGRDDMMLVRNLDLALAPEVLAYTDEAATTPLSRPQAIIAPPDAALPERLTQFLPRFAALADWETQTAV
jgi:hypothetical protein